MEYIPVVVQAVAGNGYTVYAYFADGKITCIDMTDILNKGVFRQLQDINVFRETLTVMNETVAWDIAGNRDTYNCIDIDPEEIYQCPEVKESNYIDDIS